MNGLRMPEDVQSAELRRVAQELAVEARAAVKTNSIAAISVSRALAATGDPAAAHEFASAIQSVEPDYTSSMVTQALLAAADGSVIAGDAAAAREAAAAARATADTIDDPSDRANQQARVAQALAAAGDSAAAREAAAAARATADNVDLDRRVRVLAFVAQSLAAVGDSTAAREAAAAAVDVIDSPFASPADRVNALFPVAEALADVGDTDFLRSLVGDLDPGDRIYPLLKVAHRLANAGSTTAARELAFEAKVIAETSHEFPSAGRAFDLARVAIALAEAGDRVTARNLATDAWALIKDLQDHGHFIGSAPETVVEALAAAGDSHTARVAADTISDPLARAEILAKVAEAMAAAQDMSGARLFAAAALVLIKDQDYTDSTRERIAKALAAAGDAHNARIVVSSLPPVNQRAMVMAKIAVVLIGVARQSDLQRRPS